MKSLHWLAAAVALVSTLAFVTQVGPGCAEQAENPCDPSDCQSLCVRSGLPSGECRSGDCVCMGTGADADADADADSAAEAEAEAAADADADADGDTPPEAEADADSAAEAEAEAAADADADVSGPSRLVISEIDYDQPSGDLMEFVEIYNAGASSASCANVELWLVNGSTGLTYGEEPLTCTSIAPGAFHIIADEAVLGISGCPTEQLLLASDRIENGPSDAVALMDVSSSPPVAIDQVVYDGAFPGWGEGFPAPRDPDTGDMSLQRSPPGFDTNDNAVDFRVVSPPTPCTPP